MFLLKQSTHRMLIRYDPEVGHRFVPNLRARIPREDGGGYFVVTNSLGFRSDVEFAPKKDRFRILMYGDSYTAGDNVSNAERYSDQLAAMTGAEVFNFGVSGSGTDQHLLIQRKFGRSIEADLIMLCVQIDSFHRIQVTHRPSIDRVTGRKLLVPKPYFLLENGELVLHHVPTPRERPEAKPESTSGKQEDAWLNHARDWYLKVPGLKDLRHSSLFEGIGSRIISEAKRVRASHPYPDILSNQTPGWKLMEAIVRQFIAEAAPVPVVIVPIPTKDFYVTGMDPVYQPLFEALDDPGRGIHVCDVSRPLIRLPYETRQQLSFEQGGHFTPKANQMVAGMMADFVRSRKLVPVTPPAAPAAPATAAAPALHLKPARRHSTYVLGISCFYHNSAAALIGDGEIVAAAEEERFTRVKNDRRFPHQAINFCLEQAGIQPNDLSAVAFYDNAALTFERISHSLMAVDREDSRQMWERIMPSWLRMKLHFPKLIRDFLGYDGPVLQGVHHRSHAASCFYPSPFDRAAILTIDGVGEWATASVGRGEGRHIHLLEEMRFPDSLGLLYSAFTHFTGFKVNSGEYKMMGLAPYGQPVYTQRILDHIVDLAEDGSVRLNPEYFAFLRDVHMTSPKFDELFDGPRRNPESRITRREMDLARSIQAVTEESMLRMARHAQQLTGESKLCLAGGVALNCVANGRLLREGPFEDIWIQPAAGDSGCSLGVALDVWHNYFERERAQPRGAAQGGSYLGPEFTGSEIESYLETYGYPYRKLSGDERSQFLAAQLEAGKVVGHFAGRLEFGPRSLGSRSILGDARNQAMQAELNLRIKYRESFRPFAPAVLAEEVGEFFELDRDSPYMLLVAPVRESRRLPFELPTGGDSEDLLPIVRMPRSDVPAITHVDYSARVQTVRREHHPEFHDVIRAFRDRTGYGVVVNTSFNVRGEPIVCTPQDAYRCFMRTEMEVLALGDYILLKPEQPPWPEGKGEGLENEDITKVTREEHPPELMKKLAAVFDREFWPTAERLRSNGKVLIDPSAGRERASSWVPAGEPADLKSVFELPDVLQSSNPDPREFASAMVEKWHGVEAGRQLQPVVASLLKAGLEHPAEAEVDEQVSESVYVMF